MVAHDDPKSKGTAKAANDDLDREPVVDFNALPSEVVQFYVSFYDLASSYPPQDTSEADLASSSSGRKRKGRAYSPLPTTSSRKRTAAENSAVETAAALGASAKANEDEIPCPPHFFDADAATNYLSQVATNHFASQPAPKEGEVVVGFLYKCRAKGELNRPLAHYKLSDGAADKAQLAEAVAQRSR